MSTEMIFPIALIFIVMVIIILLATGKLHDLFGFVEDISPEQEEVDLASCIIRCNDDKKLAKTFETCEEFTEEQFNEKTSKYCKDCIEVLECNITINEEKCVCDTSTQIPSIR